MDTIRLDALARHGIVHGRRLRRAGVPQSTISDWASEGRLIREHRDVFRVGGSPITYEGRLLAAAWSAGGGACHRSTAELYGLLKEGFIDIAVAPGRHPYVKGARIFRLGDLGLHPIAVRYGIPTMNPLQMLVHLGAVCDRETVEAVYDEALVQGIARPQSIEAAYDMLTAKGRNGAGLLRAIIDERAIDDGEPDSTVEMRMARLIRRSGLPPARFQFWVNAQIRVDFAYPEVKLIIEVDGRKSRATPGGFQRHTDRQNELTFGLGWKVLRVTWADVVRRPAKVARQIADALAACQA